MLSCKECRHEFEEILLGESLTREADAHLEHCAACRAFYEERVSLKRLVGELEMVAAPSDFEFRLRARMSAANRRRERFSLRGFAPGALSITLASCFALLIAVAVHFQQVAPQRISPTSKVEQAANQPLNFRSSQPAQITVLPAKSSEKLPDINSHNIRAFAAMPASHRRYAPAIRVVNVPVQVREAVSQIYESDLHGVKPAQPDYRYPLENEQRAGQLIPLRVAASGLPLKVLFKDAQGATRSISVEPVSFGARDGDVATRSVSSRQIVSHSQGVW